MHVLPLARVASRLHAICLKEMEMLITFRRKPVLLFTSLRATRFVGPKLLSIRSLFVGSNSYDS